MKRRVENMIVSIEKGTAATTPVMVENATPELSLDSPVEDLEVSVRTYNCLKNANIRTIRDLIQKTEDEMLKGQNFGRKSLNEINGILAPLALSLGLTFDENGNL